MLCWCCINTSVQITLSRSDTWERDHDTASLDINVHSKLPTWKTSGKLTNGTESSSSSTSYEGLPIHQEQIPGTWLVLQYEQGPFRWDSWSSGQFAGNSTASGMSYESSMPRPKPLQGFVQTCRIHGSPIARCWSSPIKACSSRLFEIPCHGWRLTRPTNGAASWARGTYPISRHETATADGVCRWTIALTSDRVL
jgi:hypothetical protein